MSRKAGNIPEETREALLKAATEEFTEYGFEKSSLRRICTRAGVTTGALYASFKDKDDLFENVIKPVTDHIDSVMGEHYKRERTSDCRELLEPAGEEEDVNAVWRSCGIITGTGRCVPSFSATGNTRRWLRSLTG